MFVAASVAVGLAPSLGVLVVARLVQGSAAAAIIPATMALIGQAYPVTRACAAAVSAVGGAVATASGPVLAAS